MWERIAVLMIFAIMLTAKVSGIGIKQQNEQVPMAIITTVAFVAIALYGLGKTIWNIKTDASRSGRYRYGNSASC